jgi:hypothetical protein
LEGVSFRGNRVDMDRCEFHSRQIARRRPRAINPSRKTGADRARE